MISVPTHAAAIHGRLLLASDSVAFAVIFGIFVAALLVLIVIVLMWAVRRDRAGRAEWRRRQTVMIGRLRYRPW